MGIEEDSVKRSVEVYIQTLREATPLGEYVLRIRHHWPERYFQLCKVQLSYLLDMSCDLLEYDERLWQPAGTVTATSSSPVSTENPSNNLSPLSPVLSSSKSSESHENPPSAMAGRPPHPRLAQFLAKMFPLSQRAATNSNTHHTVTVSESHSSSNPPKCNPFSSTTCSTGNVITEVLVDKLLFLFNYLSKPDNLRVKGLFRVSGCHARVMQLKAHILSTQHSRVSLKVGYHTPHDVACAIKAVLRDLEESVFTNALVPLYTETASLVARKKHLFQKASKKLHTSEPSDAALAIPPVLESDLRLAEAKQVKATRILFLLLPQLHQRLVKGLFYLLHLVSQEPLNAMSANSLGLLFAPHLLVTRETSSTELRDNYSVLSEFIAFHISSAPDLFLIPLSLSREMFVHYCSRWPVPSAQPKFQRSSSLKTLYGMRPDHQPLLVEEDTEDSNNLPPPPAPLQPDNDPLFNHAPAFVDRSSTFMAKSFVTPTRPIRHPRLNLSDTNSSTAALTLGGGFLVTSGTSSSTMLGGCNTSFNSEHHTSSGSTYSTNSGNTIDTEYAVAELFAQVQEMPEGPKKRQLIQKLNKTNGGLTPQVTAAFARATASGGLRSSIRKRIAIRQLKHLNQQRNEISNPGECMFRRTPTVLDRVLENSTTSLVDLDNESVEQVAEPAGSSNSSTHKRPLNESWMLEDTDEAGSTVCCSPFKRARRSSKTTSASFTSTAVSSISSSSSSSAPSMECLSDDGSKQLEEVAVVEKAVPITERSTAPSTKIQRRLAPPVAPLHSTQQQQQHVPIIRSSALLNNVHHPPSAANDNDPPSRVRQTAARLARLRYLTQQTAATTSSPPAASILCSNSPRCGMTVPAVGSPSVLPGSRRTNLLLSASRLPVQ